jgi:hypothetical protein
MGNRPRVKAQKFSEFMVQQYLEKEKADRQAHGQRVVQRLKDLGLEHTSDNFKRVSRSINNEAKLAQRQAEAKVLLQEFKSKLMQL